MTRSSPILPVAAALFILGLILLALTMLGFWCWREWHDPTYRVRPGEACTMRFRLGTEEQQNWLLSRSFARSARVRRTEYNGPSCPGL